MDKEEKVYGYRGDRVREHTPDHLNRRIDQATKANVQAYSAVDPIMIDERIEQLEQEWDIERILQLNASVLALTGVILGLRVDRRWFGLPLVVLPFLFQHAVQGWCPPIPDVAAVWCSDSAGN